MEKLNLNDVIEIQKIRKILIKHPLELSMFELVILQANKRINEEKIIDKLPIEPNIEPILEDHESDFESSDEE